jgi:hypothetical protein
MYVYCYALFLFHPLLCQSAGAVGVMFHMSGNESNDIDYAGPEIEAYRRGLKEKDLPLTSSSSSSSPSTLTSSRSDDFIPSNSITEDLFHLAIIHSPMPHFISLQPSEFCDLICLFYVILLLMFSYFVV